MAPQRSMQGWGRGEGWHERGAGALSGCGHDEFILYFSASIAVGIFAAPGSRRDVG